MITEHPSIEQLSELVDRDLAVAVAADVERHVATCSPCGATLDRLRALLDQAAALPESVDPPPQTWGTVRWRLTLARATNRRRPTRWVREWGLRAAAAILLVAGSSAVTVAVLRSRHTERLAAEQMPAAPTPRAMPAAVSAVERSYADAVAELTRTLHEQRSALAPATIVTLERTLKVIDEAIAEARAALAADPSNDALVDALAANYEQKVQLLRRASELPART